MALVHSSSLLSSTLLQVIEVPGHALSCRRTAFGGACLSLLLTHYPRTGQRAVIVSSCMCARACMCMSLPETPTHVCPSSMSVFVPSCACWGLASCSRCGGFAGSAGFPASGLLIHHPSQCRSVSGLRLESQVPVLAGVVPWRRRWRRERGGAPPIRS
ncbi:hypothetical protein B0J13DRAFT_222369 [Dactylonectria estremocensis]|uniref:Uncharacterized protein n=1 Tax=Dactylonectria estremocensis TaxID=1079267 RepID=A0A9P9F5R7_9HYPO|nr:hypothetical protein B0J13DRAFT_222369 [Dactylonectria estremocensis]